MSVEKIIESWKKNKFKTVYWLEGEEEYYIDQLVDFAEHKLLTPEEASFNLTVFYGKDAEWAEVLNACRRYPMFAEKQVVILKEAQQMRDLEKLQAYVDAPLSSTIFIGAHKHKTLDKRKALYKSLKSSAEIFTSNKLRDDHVPGWIEQYVKAKGMVVTPKTLSLLSEHLGNDLSRITNEIEKLTINLEGRKNISEDDIEKYIGISKEYNVFELQEALSSKDLSRSLRIINYFQLNPKALPIHMILPALYGHFSRVYAAYGMNEMSQKGLFFNNSHALQQAKKTMANYGYDGVEKIILLLHHYNLRSIGIGDTGTEDASLLKEMVVKIMMG
ncbi:MAG: DNA polymerase III subunit delta [Ferruginibacter sp.]